MKHGYFISLVVIIYIASFNQAIGQAPVVFENTYNRMLVDTSDADMNEAKSIVCAQNGNIYVTGQCVSNTLNSSSVIKTIELNSAGAILNMAINTNTNPMYFDAPVKILSDTSSNIYVLGHEKVSDSLGDQIVLFKYNGSLSLQWKVSFGVGGSIYDVPYDMTFDATGNIIICCTTSQFEIRKYNTSGTLLWTSTFSKRGPGYLATDGTGNVFLINLAYSSTREKRIRTAKYNASGVMQWEKYWDADTSKILTDYPRGIKTDKFGNVFVVGLSDYGTATGQYAILIKYNTSGKQMWTKRWGEKAVYDFDQARGVGTDSLGNVYVTSLVSNNTSTSYISTRKYSPTGTLEWTNNFNGPIAVPFVIGDDDASGIFVNPNGTCYVIGKSYYGTEKKQFGLLLLKYSSSGVLQWTNLYYPQDQFGNLHYSTARSIASNPSFSSIVVCGGEWTDSLGSAWVVQRFSPTYRLAGIDPTDQVDKDTQYSLNIFPNPAVNELNISSDKEISKIIITDLVGMKIKDISYENIKNENIFVDISDLAAGIYICTVVRDKDVISRKINKY